MFVFYNSLINTNIEYSADAYIVLNKMNDKNNRYYFIFKTIQYFLSVSLFTLVYGEKMKNVGMNSTCRNIIIETDIFFSQRMKNRR